MAKRTVLITGGSRGIGYAACELFARNGWNVAFCGTQEKTVRAAEAKLKTATSGATILGIVADIGAEADITRMFAAVQKQFGTLDALVNNAAVLHLSRFPDINMTEWEHTMRVNVTGMMLCCREAFKIHQKREPSARPTSQRMHCDVDFKTSTADSGQAPHASDSSSRNGGNQKSLTIVNIASLAGISGLDKFPGLSTYAISKGAVITLSETLAMEGKPFGIRVNCIAPGATETEMLHKAAPGLKANAQPMDVAKAIYFLADDAESGIITGSVLPLYSNG